MTLFRPCIDLHEGHVKQIVGGTLDHPEEALVTNFVASQNAAYYADRYRKDALYGGHVIRLGDGNDAAARSALSSFPKGLQLGGGITPDTARDWLADGADKVIVTSFLFDEADLDMQRVEQMASTVGPDQLVIDLSCRRVDSGWRVTTQRWRTITKTALTPQTLRLLSDFCGEYLIHAADVEGKCEGIDGDLVRFLGDHCPLPCTYAGGAAAIHDLDTVAELSCGRVDLTFGSALDIFGGRRVRYVDCVRWNRNQKPLIP